MSLKGLNEFELINKLTRGLEQDKTVLKAAGDDAALIRIDTGKYLLYTTDMLVEDVHFKVNKIKPGHIGRKAMCVNISDIAAMGGEPKYAVISAGLPARLSFDYIKELFRGLASAAARYKVSIVGGDTNLADKLTINVALIGRADKNNVVFRHGAKAGDIIMVSGSLGGSRFGKHYNFKPRLELSRYLVSNHKIHALIDISDGLISDLQRVLEASKKTAVLYSKNIPLSSKAKSLESALYDGEDYELLFTCCEKEAAKIEKKSGSLKPTVKISRIGRIAPAGKDKIKLLDDDGRSLPVKYRRVFSHF